MENFGGGFKIGIRTNTTKTATLELKKSEAHDGYINELLVSQS
jgi:hypothetical protein